MKTIELAIGTDHRGYKLKEQLIVETFFGSFSVIWHDVGTYSDDRTDYPLYAQKVCNHIIEKEVSCGVLLCGSGVGISIAANRNRGIYAGLAWNETVARLAKEHDNCNVLVLPADFVTEPEAKRMVTAWLNARFNGDEYAERIAMID